MTDFDFANTFLLVPEAELGALLSPSNITEGIISTLDIKYFLVKNKQILGNERK